MLDASCRPLMTNRKPLTISIRGMRGSVCKATLQGKPHVKPICCVHVSLGISHGWQD
jgi:hypothetical protein